MMRRIHPILIVCIFLLTSCATTQRVTEKPEKLSEKSVNLQARLPVEPGIVKGKLDNDLTYYIRVNHKPEKRMELRLVINAGSVLEDNDQQGLAHFVEHMAFNGTEHFEKQELVNYLESIGMRFGPDLNAYTGFDETVYMLQVPTDSVHIVEKAFQILEDWAHNITFDDEEIDKERGVIIEEWRSGRGAETRMRDKQLPILFQGSRYAERLPIGKMEIVEHAPYETLRRFYREWYRPELMAVIAVGDFDSKWIETLINSYFSRIPYQSNPRTRQVFRVPNHEETLFALATDPEATRNSVSIYYKHEVTPEITVADYRKMIVENIYNRMLSQRLDELTKQSDPPFLYGYSAKGSIVRSKEVYVLGARVEDNGIERGLEALMTEAARVKRYGFTRSELDRQKKEMLRYIELAYNERDKTESINYASEYTRNFLSEEPIPGIEFEYEIYQKYIPGITLEEINSLAGKWISDQNRVILVNAPEKPEIQVPGRGLLLSVINAVDEKDIQPYVDTLSEQPLVSVPPVPGTVLEEKEIEELGITEWKLSNGVRIVLKPTDFKNDEILFTSFSEGGNSLVPDENFIAARTATSVIGEGGIGNFNLIELNKKLSGKVVSVSPWIGELQEGISGSASPEDSETMFRLIYLYFTSPRKDSTAFLSLKSRLKGFIENRSVQPEATFNDTVAVTMAQYHHRSRPWSLDLLDEMDLNTSVNIYRERFADAGDFTFFFVGAFDPSSIKPLVETYLGGLPADNRSETWRDVGITYPEGIVAKEVKQGLEPKSLVNIFFTGPFVWTRQNRYDIDSMVSVLRIKLREIMREDLGGTYGVGVSVSLSHHPREEYKITISFGCAPERVGELTDAAFTQIDSLKTTGTTDVYLTKVKEMQKRERETDLKENSFWLNALRFYYYHGEDPQGILEYDTLVENLSLDAIRKAAQSYFDMNNYVKVVLLPEGS